MRAHLGDRGGLRPGRMWEALGGARDTADGMEGVGELESVAVDDSRCGGFAIRHH